MAKAAAWAAADPANLIIGAVTAVADDAVAPAVLYAVVWRRVAAIGFGWDHCLDPGVGQFVADRIGVVAPVRQQGIDPVSHHAHQRAETLDVMRLSRCQDKGERASAGIASGVQLGGEPTARATERLGRPSSFFMPAAQ